MKIAILHDHLTQEGGAEKVLKIFHEMYPEAPIFTLVYDKKKMGNLVNPTLIRTSFLQKIPWVRNNYQWLLPLMPIATERHNLNEFDLVLSSSSAFAKGVITKPDTIHICYCHTPTRYLWTDTHSYVKELTKGKWIKPIIHVALSYLRLWDRLSADRVDYFIANSKTVQGRITKYYRRASSIICPPVDVDQFTIRNILGNYFLAGGRLVAYKRFDLVIQAFNRLHLPLKIFGTGPELSRLKAMARPNIEFVGKVTDEERATLYEHCLAYINPQEEDFGITAVEAMAAGRPVIAYAAGGALETVIEGETGTFFRDQDFASLITAVLHFKPEHYSPEKIREHALQFSTAEFKRKIGEYVIDAMKAHNTTEHQAHSFKFIPAEGIQGTRSSEGM